MTGLPSVHIELHTVVGCKAQDGLLPWQPCATNCNYWVLEKGSARLHVEFHKWRYIYTCVVICWKSKAKSPYTRATLWLAQLDLTTGERTVVTKAQLHGWRNFTVLAQVYQPWMFLSHSTLCEPLRRKFTFLMVQTQVKGWRKLTGATWVGATKFGTTW